MTRLYKTLQKMQLFSGWVRAGGGAEAEEGEEGERNPRETRAWPLSPRSMSTFKSPARTPALGLTCSQKMLSRMNSPRALTSPPSASSSLRMLSPREHKRHEAAAALEAGSSVSRGAEHCVTSAEESARYADKLRSAIIDHVLAGVYARVSVRAHTCGMNARNCASCRQTY